MALPCHSRTVTLPFYLKIKPSSPSLRARMKMPNTSPQILNQTAAAHLCRPGSRAQLQSTGSKAQLADTHACCGPRTSSTPDTQLLARANRAPRLSNFSSTWNFVPFLSKPLCRESSSLRELHHTTRNTSTEWLRGVICQPQQPGSSD